MLLELGRYAHGELVELWIGAMRETDARAREARNGGSVQQLAEALQHERDLRMELDRRRL